MRHQLAMAALAVIVATPAITPEPALARDRSYEHRNGYYDRNGNYHRGSKHYRGRCDGGNGAVGTVAGGVGGALIGDAVGGGTLGTVAGGVGGALLGRHLDKKNTKAKKRLLVRLIAEWMPVVT